MDLDNTANNNGSVFEADAENSESNVQSVPSSVNDTETEEIFIDESDSEIKTTDIAAPSETAGEYVYNGYDSFSEKESKGGKITLYIIAALLAVFVVSVVSISAYIAFSGRALEPDSSSDFLLTPGKSDAEDIDTEPSKQDNNSDNDDKADDISDDSTPAFNQDQNYPTLEQLASAPDAISLPQIYDKVSPSVVGVSCRLSKGSATGTGIIISKDGYVITNAHVVEDAVSVMIVDSDFEEYSAKIIGSDTQTDLAVLKVDGVEFTPCEFGKSGDLRVGELAVVIGNPLGFDLYGTMTTGIISGLNRTITIGEKNMTLIQTQASINRGNSGGPLINCYGQVIGVTSAKVDPLYGEGLGFAIPIDDALPILDDLIRYGYVTGRPMIGISGEDINAITSLYYRIPQGICVRFVTPDSGAEKAGIKAGDIIIGVNGESITTMDELTAIKNSFSAGDTITVTIYRDGTNMDIDIVLSEVTKEQNQ